jgi:MFS family permease
MYVLLALGNAAGTVGRPARTALLPQLVPKRIFNNAVTWNSSIFETASVLGPAVGGFVCGRSIPLTFALAATCWLACFVFVAALPDVPPPRRDASHHGSSLSNLLAGLRFVFREKLMLSAMTLDLFAVLFGGAAFLYPVFATDILGVGPLGFGFLRAAPALGAFSMAIVLAHLPPMQRAGRALLLAVAGFGVATIVFGISRNFLLSFAMLVLIGMFDNISVVVRHTLVQLLTPDSMRGRVSSVNQIFIGSSNEIGGIESTVTAQWFGPVWSVVIGGIGTLIVVVMLAFVSPPLRRLGSLRDIQPSEPEPEPQGFPVVPVAR